MQTTSTGIMCPACGRDLPQQNHSCHHCHASADWIEVLEAIEFTDRRFVQWGESGLLSKSDREYMQDYYAKLKRETVPKAQNGQPIPTGMTMTPWNQCWSCAEPRKGKEEYCLECGAPVDRPAIRSLRYFTFAERELQKHETLGNLPLSVIHECQTDVSARSRALRRKLESERLAMVIPLEETDSGAAPSSLPIPVAPEPERGASSRRREDRSHRHPERSRRREEEHAHERETRRESAPRRPLWEIILDPRSIQWLLGSGGALLVIGLVVWLYASGLVVDTLTIAVGLGIINAAVLLLGWGLVLRTRYQLAGRALTLLACLVMPLNLWYYHANELMTLNNIWMAALVCTFLYAASALVLRDALFVYVLEGGLAMTGLLILADLGMFMEIAGPSTLLIVMGLIALHLERVFPAGRAVFSRERFGRAFFWSSLVLLGSGLLLLAGGQLAGWLFDPVFHRYFGLEYRPAIVQDETLRWLAIGLVVACTYAFLYADLVVRRVGVYINLAVFTFLWAEVLIVLQVGAGIEEETLIVVLAVTSLAVNGALAYFGDTVPNAMRTAPALALLLSAVPVLLGVVLFLRAIDETMHENWPYTLNWSFVAAMASVALCCRGSAFLLRRQSPFISATYFFGTATATMVGAVGLLSVLGVTSWDRQVPLLMLIPNAYLLAAYFYRGHTAEKPLIVVAHTATIIVVISVLLAALNITEQSVQFLPKSDTELLLLLAAFWALTAVFYIQATIYSGSSRHVYAAALALCAVVWQLMYYWNVDPMYYTAGYAVFGLVQLIAYRFAGLERWNKTRLPAATFACANALITLALVGGALQALAKILLMVDRQTLKIERDLEWKMIYLLLGLGAISLASAWIVRHRVWRPWYLVAAVMEGLLIVLLLQILSTLTIWEKVEMFSILVGLVLLAFSHWGWYRESERENELVDVGLWFGGLLVALPLTIAVIYYRTGQTDKFHVPNELGMLILGLLMFASGIVLRLKATTLCGGGMLAIYLLGLSLFLKYREAGQSAGLALAIGGGVLFLIGLLLSLYRDRLLTLPQRIKRREGVFRVLSWR